MMRSNGIVLLVAVVAVAAVARGDDWPQFLGPNRNGQSTETRWSSDWPDVGPPVLWKTNVGVGHSSVAISDGRLFTMGNKNDVDTVYCLDPQTGAGRWKYSYRCKAGPYPGPHSTPTVDGAVVFTYSREGDLLCLEAKSGKPIWARNLKVELKSKGPRWDYACSPLVLGRMLIVHVGGKGSSVVALDKSDGKLIWQCGDEVPSHSSPITFQVDGKTRIAMFTATALLGVDSASGKQLWQYPWENRPYNVSATPIVSGDKVFISSAYGGGCALLKVAGDRVSEVWRGRQMSNHFNNCMLWKGYLYGTHGHTGGSPPLRCLDFQTGEVMWSHRIRGGAALLLAGGKLILLTGEGELRAVDPSPDGYKEVARAKVLNPVCWTPPVLSGGRIYGRNNDGDLVCLDVRLR